MDWTTINLGPEIYGEGKTTQPWFISYEEHMGCLSNHFDMAVTSQTVRLEVLKFCSQTCNFKVWGQIWDHLVAFVALKIPSCPSTRTSNAKNESSLLAFISNLAGWGMGVELTKIWGYGHHEAMVMGHFESWVPLDPCFFVGLFNDQWTLNQLTLNQLTHQCIPSGYLTCSHWKWP